MQLTKNFALWELIKSQTATRRNINNTPPSYIVSKLQITAANILQPVRDRYGIPFTPNSGYRSPKLNKAIGGSRTSQHMIGEAVDFEVPGISNKDLALWIRENLDFDQLILEFWTGGNSGWVHCSYKPLNNRKQVLTASKRGRRTIYTPGIKTVLNVAK